MNAICVDHWPARIDAECASPSRESCAEHGATPSGSVNILGVDPGVDTPGYSGSSPSANPEGERTSSGCGGTRIAMRGNAPRVEAGAWIQPWHTLAVDPSPATCGDSPSAMADGRSRPTFADLSASKADDPSPAICSNSAPTKWVYVNSRGFQPTAGCKTVHDPEGVAPSAAHIWGLLSTTLTPLPPPSPNP
jgi:hypothetical protein